MAPARLARGLPGLLTSVGLSLCAASTVAQEAPRGFALPDVAGIVATWPFTDRAFTAGAPTGGNGGAVWGFIGLVTVVPGTAILRELFWYVDRRLRGQSPDEAFAQSRLHNPALDGAPERDLEAIEAAG